MTVEAANRYIPKSDQMTAAYDIVNQWYFTIGNTINEIKKTPFEKLGQVAGDYFTAGVAYLANRGHDSYIEEVGTTMWWMINQRRVLPVMTDNMLGAAIHLGVPPQIALAKYSINTEPQVLFGANRVGIQQIETAYVIIPPEFIHQAKSKPIEALAAMTWIGSQVRDMANGRLFIDPKNIGPRSLASEAHFLHEAVERHPDVKLPDFYREVMQKYPHGIQSLPRSARYRGSSGDEFKTAHFN